MHYLNVCQKTSWISLGKDRQPGSWENIAPTDTEQNKEIQETDLRAIMR